MIRVLRAAAVLLFVSSPVLAEKVTDFTLPNGLQVVVIEDHRAPVVVHMVWYRVGAADAPAQGGVGPQRLRAALPELRVLVRARDDEHPHRLRQ